MHINEPCPSAHAVYLTAAKQCAGTCQHIHLGLTHGLGKSKVLMDTLPGSVDETPYSSENRIV